MLQPDRSCLHGQHHCGLVHQQGRGYEVRLSLSPPLETKCDCRQTVRHNQVIQTEWSLLLEVFALLCQRWHIPSVDLFATRFNHKLARFVSPVPDRSAWKVDVLSLRWEDLDAYACPSSSGGCETIGPRVPSHHSDCSRVAQHALVLGPGQHVSSHSPLASLGGEFDNSTIQPVSSQGPPQSKPPCLAPRASAIQQAGFSAEVATRIEAPQRRSTRAIYESKWSVFVRWCEEDKVDVRTPSKKQIADFLLFLFQERHLQPSTIEGYRTAIADKVGNVNINISKDKNLTRLLDSFHTIRDKPKGRRGIPAWNLSLVLHQLTKPPFEPLRKAPLKHLTFKTVFLLALGSGKWRSEIHAWIHKNIRHQEDWSNVSLSPPLQASSLRITWLRRAQLVWLRLSYQP